MGLEIHHLACKVKHGKIDAVALWRPLGDVSANGPMVSSDVKGPVTLRLEAHDSACLASLPVSNQKERQASTDLPFALHVPQISHGGLSSLIADHLGNGPQQQASFAGETYEQRKFQDVSKRQLFKAPA